MNSAAIEQREPGSDVLWKYAHVGKVLAQNMALDDVAGREALLQVLSQWTEQLRLPRLSSYGMTEADIPHVVANCRGSSMKTNPVLLTDQEVAKILIKRL